MRQGSGKRGSINGVEVFVTVTIIIVFGSMASLAIDLDQVLNWCLNLPDMVRSAGLASAGL